MLRGLAGESRRRASVHGFARGGHEGDAGARGTHLGSLSEASRGGDGGMARRRHGAPASSCGRRSHDAARERAWPGASPARGVPAVLQRPRKATMARVARSSGARESERDSSVREKNGGNRGGSFIVPAAQIGAGLLRLATWGSGGCCGRLRDGARERGEEAGLAVAACARCGGRNGMTACGWESSWTGGLLDW